MSTLRQFQAPHVIRLKSKALDRLPIYMEREGWNRVLALVSEGLPSALTSRGLAASQIQHVEYVTENSKEWVENYLDASLCEFQAVLGLGGGKALDVAKYLAYRLDLPYLAVPTSLSNDGFCSPNASLTVKGKRKSLKARLPMGVVVDLEVALGAPRFLWLSGVGDLVAKWTAVPDWKIAFHTDGTAFDDLPALLSDASVFQFMAHPFQDEKGVQLLAQALLFNGVAMAMAGSSRPASGSEHLISHALDELCERPRPHGLQVGLATYWMSLVQQQDTGALDQLFCESGFWSHWKEHPMQRNDWLAALERAPSIKSNFVTILSDSEALERAKELLESDPHLQDCLKP